MASLAKLFTRALSDIQLAPISNNETTTLSAGNAVYYYATFDIPNEESLFRIGMTVKVDIEYNSRKNVLSIPVAALNSRINGDTATVYIVRNAVKVPQEIKIGADDQLFVEVSSGLQPEDEVVVAQPAESKKVDDEGIFGL